MLLFTIAFVSFVPRSKPDAARTETDIQLGQGVLNPC